MDIDDVLLSLGLLIITAKLLEGLFKRFGISAFVAYAAAGILLGPVTGLVELGDQVELILGIGIFMFFFLVGLEELDIRGFVAAIRGRLFLASVLSVAISTLISLAVTTDVLIDLGLNLSFTEALGIAGVLSLSSLGVVAKVLIDEGRLKEPVGVQMFTAVIIAELMALFVVGFAISEHFAGEGYGHTLDLPTVATLLGQIFGYSVLVWLFSTMLLPKIVVFLHRVLHVPQLSFGLLLGGLFLVVVGADFAGLHGSLGALLFGAALSTLPYQVRRDIMPGMKGTAEGLFVPLFFASAGLHFNLDFLDLPAQTILVLALIPLIGKIAASFVSTYITRIEQPLAIATGLMAKGVAEIALLLLMFNTGAISQSVYSLLAIVMFGYILFTPMLIRFTLKRLDRAETVVELEHLPPSLYQFALEGVKVSDILDRSRSYPDQSITVKAFIDVWLFPEQRDYVVIDEGKFAGIASLSMMRYLPRSEWDDALLDRVLRRNPPIAKTDDFVEDALQRMTENSLTVLPVFDPDTDEFVGSISTHEVLEMLVLNAKGH